ncbi:DNA polymerase-3 subunit delta [Sphingomonas kaistensis]|uniref:DNA-directed DNA polymerase n=1 Tax=Sphingomonas kaistensis TaxID=298708 RepID=A0A7X5Y5C9_9SPHN|nr:DNA polymerase III subunit delta [Sphingomonas kaistensis]NJC04862.1 DNA polymerase-3 subunit delta [Sphingomonas kaistensis]
MRLTRDKAGSALDRPDPSRRFYLFSGADNASSRLFAQRLLAALGAEKVSASAAQLKADPAWLADEAASLPMFGGARLLWIEPAGEEILPAVEALLALEQFEAPAVAITNGSLKKTSGLLKLAEGSQAALHVASEQQTPREQMAAIADLARKEGLTVSPALAERIAGEAGGDLILARLELQKFALYAGASPDHPVELGEDVVDALGIDQAEAEYGRAGDLALAGDIAGLATELSLMEAAAMDAIPVVRALQRRLLMLAPLRARVEQGQPLGSVTQSVWQRDKPMVGRILPRWTAPRLSEAFDRVQKLERALLLRPVPSGAALGETLMQLARVAASSVR